ncbi:MAG TPA: STY4526/YPO1902 family pathogenicity island replication protein [Cellvibrionaceae bacterium]|nr:STY4526/YPO1902 family pathogenicity island replication protein [Cellvibrionaceae bacterium]HMY38810.1 STY4526/YPO1902 family pathogenicity island replication protein [Marinagarivorans sp.]HNG60121.1 STY4526/YPO1902 family pathogenicity island replication protein [Cellvibrionaceae bacterium]
MRTDFYNLFNQQVLYLAVSALKADNEKLIAHLGLSRMAEDTRQQISNLSLSQLVHVADFRGLLAEVRFNESQLINYLKMAASKTVEDQLIDEAIVGGMRQPMLQTLKGISRREFNSRREKLGVSETGRGRIGNLDLDEDEELKVIKVWQELIHKTDDMLERYVLLHRETGLPLDKAQNTIQQLFA